MMGPAAISMDAVSALEGRSSLAKALLGNFCDYSENVPKWPGDVERLATLSVSNYPPVGGLADLRHAIVERERVRLGVDLSIENVTITNGAMHALSLLFRLLKGSALCQAPLFKNIFDQLTSLGNGVSLFGGWSQGHVAIERALQHHANAKIIYVNLPNNPTGMVLDQQSTDLLIDSCLRDDRHLIVDMVYDDFVFGQTRMPQPLRSAKDFDAVFIVNSFSKNYGAPDLRLGWVISSKRNIRRLNAALERDCITVAGGSQQIALGLMRRGNADLISAVRTGRELVSTVAGDHRVLKLWAPSCGTHFLWEMGGRDVSDFADYLLSHYQTLVSTSENYAGSEQAFIRLPLGYPEKTIAAAISVIRAGFQEWDSARKCNGRDGEYHETPMRLKGMR
jgi:aspartate aminotransferase